MVIPNCLLIHECAPGVQYEGQTVVNKGSQFELTITANDKLGVNNFRV